VNNDDEDTLLLAQELRRSLKDGGILPLRFNDSLRHQGYLVNGELCLNVGDIPIETYAACSISVMPTWRTENPPIRCLSAWSLELQRSQNSRDWHLNRDGTVCYVLPTEWRKVLGCSSGKDSREQIELGAFFCLRNLSYLLVRQLVRYRSGLKSWPQDWPQWGHGIHGLNEYQKETREKNAL
jgi:hypothetical protein